jgi:hypothetical protein
MAGANLVSLTFTTTIIILCGFELWVSNAAPVRSAINPVKYAHFYLTSDARNDYHDVIAIACFG